MKKEEPTITITIKLYNEMNERLTWLECLEGAGVDNWDGFAYAQDLYAEAKGA